MTIDFAVVLISTPPPLDAIFITIYCSTLSPTYPTFLLPHLLSVLHYVISSPSLDLYRSMYMYMLVCMYALGVDMKPETIAEIATHPNVIGVKDATGDITRVESLRRLCGKDFLLYSGEDDLGCEFVRVGGDGVISVTANVAPKSMHKMLALSKAGTKAEAEAINETLMPLHKRLFLESNPIPVKKAMFLMGKIGPGMSFL